MLPPIKIQAPPSSNITTEHSEQPIHQPICKYSNVYRIKHPNRTYRRNPDNPSLQQNTSTESILVAEQSTTQTNPITRHQSNRLPNQIKQHSPNITNIPITNQTKSDQSTPNPTFNQDDATVQLAIHQQHLLHSIQAAMAWKPPTPSKPVFEFNFSIDAAKHNTKVLTENNNNLTRIITNNNTSILRPGSEFCPQQLLQPIFQGHPLWPELESIITKGAHSPLDTLSESARHQDNTKAITYGNHKATIREKATVLEELETEINQGWQLPIKLLSITTIPAIVIAPLGIVTQKTVDKK